MKKIRKCKCNQGVAPSSKTIYWEIISWEHEVATSAWNYLLTEKPKAEKNSIIGGNQHCPLYYNLCSSHRRWVKKDTHTFYLGNFKVNQKNNEKNKVDTFYFKGYFKRNWCEVGQGKENKPCSKQEQWTRPLSSVRPTILRSVKKLN